MTLILGLSLEAAAAAQDLTELARRAKHSVVTLKVFDRLGRELGEGSGFFVDPEGIIVTNHHVIAQGHRIEAVLSTERSVEIAGLLAKDESNDLAVVQVDAAEAGPFPPLFLDTAEAVEVGQRIVVLGNPLGLGWSLSEGIVSAVRESKDLPVENAQPVLQITAAISPGSSGSPVMNLDGEVVGVVVSQVTTGQNLNFAVPLRAVRALLNRLDASTPMSPISGAELVTSSGSDFLRNAVISLLFFAALVVGFRYLR